MATTIRKPGWLAIPVLAPLLAAVFLALWMAGSAYASTISIDDQARVLDAGKIQSAAAKLPNPLLIYTTRIFVGEQDAFNQATRQRLPDQRSIVMGIDVVHRHLSIESGSEVKLSDDQASTAVDAFKNNYNNGDYTGATLASISSLHDSLTGATSGSNDFWSSTAGTVVIVLLSLGIPGLIIFFLVKTWPRRNTPPRDGGRRRWGYYGGYYGGSHSSAGSNSSYGGGAGSSFGGGFGGGGGAGGSF